MAPLGAHGPDAALAASRSPPGARAPRAGLMRAQAAHIVDVFPVRLGLWRTLDAA
jgi:hypothetical protein